MNKRYYLVDYIHFIYFFIVSLIIIIFRQKIEKFYLYIIFFTIYSLYIIEISKLYKQHPNNILIKFLRLMYPILFFTFVYKIISGYVTVFYDRFLDEYVLQLQNTIFGGQPVLMLEKIVSPYFTEYMKFSYFTYYLYLPTIGFLLFFKKRYKDLIEFVTIISFVFYICYIGFVIFPVEGPRFTLIEFFKIKYLKGFFFTNLQNIIMKHGAVTGACVPSSHIAVAWTALYFIKKFFGSKTFYIILPFTISLSLAVVYNRYHYTFDVILGWIFAYIGIKLGYMLLRKYETG